MSSNPGVIVVVCRPGAKQRVWFAVPGGVGSSNAGWEIHHLFSSDQGKALDSRAILSGGMSYVQISFGNRAGPKPRWSQTKYTLTVLDKLAIAWTVSTAVE